MTHQKFLPLKIVDFDEMGLEFIPVGKPLETEVSQIVITSTLDQDCYLSLDGDNKHLLIPFDSTLQLQMSFAKRVQFFVMASHHVSPGRGSLALSCISKEK